MNKLFKIRNFLIIEGIILILFVISLLMGMGVFGDALDVLFGKCERGGPRSLFSYVLYYILPLSFAFSPISLEPISCALYYGYFGMQIFVVISAVYLITFLIYKVTKK